MISNVLTNNAQCNTDEASQKEMGSKIMLSSNSCLKAASSIKAALKPRYEQYVALNIRFIPRPLGLNTSFIISSIYCGQNKAPQLRGFF
jgi:hypothetical protein